MREVEGQEEGVEEFYFDRRPLLVVRRGVFDPYSRLRAPPTPFTKAREVWGALEKFPSKLLAEPDGPGLRL